MRAAGQELEFSLKTAEAACLYKCLDTDSTSHRSSASRVQNSIGSILIGVNLLPMAEATKKAPAGENSEVRRIPQLDFDFTYKVEVGY